MTKKICFIGYGNMAKAIAQKLCTNPAWQLFATSPSLPISITGEGITTHSNNGAFISNADIVFIAVKPMYVETVLNEIKKQLSPASIVISVATGINLAKLASHCLPGQPIIRCMPNTPAAVGKAATPLIANTAVTYDQKKEVDLIFSSLGITTWLNDEEKMDAFTAVSGSGPAYVFYFIEAMISAAENIGLDRTVATSFTFQTLAGSLALLQETELSARELRKKVTSQGGTTAAAIGILEQQGFKQLIQQAIQAAHTRAQQLSGDTA